MQRINMKIISTVLIVVMVLSMVSSIDYKVASATGEIVAGTEISTDETGFTAMIGFQTSDYDHRETYEDQYYSTGQKYLEWLTEQEPEVDLSNMKTCNGRNIYYNGNGAVANKKTLQLRRPETVELNKDAVASDVKMTADGEYTVAINNLNLNSNPDGSEDAEGEIFNMLYVAVDIPMADAANVEVKASSVKIDGEVVASDVVLPQKYENKKYGQFMVADAYRPDNYTNGVGFGKDANALRRIPEQSIEITFSISGVDWSSPKYQPEEIVFFKPDATVNPIRTPIPNDVPIPVVKLSQPFDIGVVANLNKALTTVVVDPQAANGKIFSSVFGSIEYWSLLKTSTVNHSTGEADYGDHKQTFYETADASMHIAETGQYNLTVTALEDSEDLIEDGAIWLEIIPNKIPVNYRLAGHSITVRDKIYAWDGKLEDDGENIRLFVCNQWEIDNDQKSTANSVKSVVPVKKGDKITFTFTIFEEISTSPDSSGEPGKPTQEPEMPTQEPEMPTQEPEMPTQEPEMPTQEPVLSTQEPGTYTQKPEIPADKPSNSVTQPEDNNLADDASKQDLKVMGLDITTDNVVKKGFLSVPQVQLTWDINRNCDGYEIWKKEENQSFVKVDYIDDSDEVEWFDTNLKKGCKYIYKVLAYVEEDDGTVSRAKDGNSVSVKIRQSVKSCTYAAKRTGRKLKITFKKAEGSKYQIQVKYGKSKKWKKASGSLKKKILKKVSPKKLKVRVRTCEKVNGKMKYSRWSKAKTVR